MKTPEDLLRENVRDLISLVKKKNKNTQTEEQKLRAIIREFLQYELKEAKMHEYIKSGMRVADGVRGNPDYPDFHIRRELKINPDATREELVKAVMDSIPMSREKAEAAVDKHSSGEKDIEEGAASSGRVVTPDRGGEDRRAGDERKRPMEESEQMFAPNHYCVHHGGVQRNGSVELAEAVAHNYNEELGRVTHYDMKFADGTILENVAFEDIQVTNASLAEGHGSHPAKSDHKDKRDEELDEAEKMPMKDEPEGEDLNQDGKKGHGKVPAFLDKGDVKKKKSKGKQPPQLAAAQKKKMSESQIREIIRKLVKEAMAKKAK